LTRQSEFVVPMLRFISNTQVSDSIPWHDVMVTILARNYARGKQSYASFTKIAEHEFIMSKMETTNYLERRFSWLGGQLTDTVRRWFTLEASMMVKM
jgi:hypothetical protein